MKKANLSVRLEYIVKNSDILYIYKNTLMPLWQNWKTHYPKVSSSKILNILIIMSFGFSGANV